MYPGVELRLYRYVVALAEELNFTRAALRLHVAQASLSKQIPELESYLGAQLFDRTKRDVRLTAAGEAFAAEARRGELAATTTGVQHIASYPTTNNGPDCVQLFYFLQHSRLAQPPRSFFINILVRTPSALRNGITDREQVFYFL